MSEKTSKGTQRIDELYIIGVDGSGIGGKIVYKLDNDKEKIIEELGTLDLGDLFKGYSK